MPIAGTDRVLTGYRLGHRDIEQGRHDRYRPYGLIVLQTESQRRVTRQGNIAQRLAGTGHDFNQLQHMVGAFEQQGDQLAIDLDGALAQAIEHVFDDMGKTDDGAQAEQSGRALDGVRRAEDRTDGVVVIGFGLQVQQRRLHVLEQLACFDDEGLLCLVEIDGHDRVPFIAPGSENHGKLVALDHGWPSVPPRSHSSNTSSTAGLCPLSCSATPVRKVSRLASINSCRPAPSISVTCERSISKGLPSVRNGASSPWSSAAV